jgi:hypothetical protein
MMGKQLSRNKVFVLGHHGQTKALKLAPVVKPTLSQTSTATRTVTAITP